MAKDNEQLLKNPSLASEPCFKQLATSEQTLAVQRKKRHLNLMKIVDLSFALRETNVDF